ncbi:CoA-binding protein [Marinoscillum sp. 108]|uniref:CoA-binding protein n=1 Tax=Marinoscillum sp. 108 TaxID=2653151 RepID=UPI0012F3FDC2|nr:CoA-binding protein [Marinoscillum sp. 108]VXD10495.1 CoA-binding protein [Marinoscillum sp. 108]
MDKKKTVIIGATPNPTRYAFLAAERLTNHQHPVVPVGIKRGEVFGKEILDLREKPSVDGVDTITLYLNPTHQREWEEYILSLQPKRIIFNPGTENDRLAAKAADQGIETLNACTLVMLSASTF